MMPGMRKTLSSFSYAFQGLRHAYRTQRNLRFHMLAAAVVAVLTFWLPLTASETLFVTAVAFAVIICELLNTAIEAAVDLAGPHPHPLAKIAKDVAAAAVTVTAFFALVTGIIVFFPLFYEIAGSRTLQPAHITAPSAIASLALLFLAGSAFTGRRRADDSVSKRDSKRNDGRQEWKPMPFQIISQQELRDDERELLHLAMQAREHAYAPYSRFRVGSAVRAGDGTVYAGCNVENAAYGSSNCAERSALFHAVSRGAKPRTYRMLAVVGETDLPITPCGACRQVIGELCDPHMPIILGNMKGQAVRTTAAELLPGAFTARALQGEHDSVNTEEGE